MAKHYNLAPTTDTLHGFFSKDLDPVIEIESGDTVVFETLDSAWGIEKRPALGKTRPKFTNIKPHRRPEHFGHALVGPVYINGAKPGQVLEITINNIVPGTWGWTSAGGFKSYWNEKMALEQEPEVMLDFAIDYENNVAFSQFHNFSYNLKVNPFMGIMGMPPPIAGNHSTIVPRPWGGNIDCKELQAGSKVYFPIPVKGCLFSTGDGHAVQGDGEVSGPGLECPMKEVNFTFNIIDDMELTMPRAKTNTGWITMGFHENLEEAMWIALNEMVHFISSLYNIERTEAYALASLVVDLRITQIVNTVKGVHAVLPFDSIR
ncbi:Acetamidase/formamidase [Oceanobacillus limi]|uniref:Acetamidase/formamidase n=1 Tax=Oceanobacillus limi TaxID=930131 RepID=A0A1H9Y223_9BACI|nr:acetamidase/formamidase family protein [Oceanobacillus limi]SES62342.1 Acetamidase/formamidase [Oceanobacillus limi]